MVNAQDDKDCTCENIPEERSLSPLWRFWPCDVSAFDFPEDSSLRSADP